MSCDECPLKGQPKTSGSGDRLASFAIVGEAPGRSEASLRQHFIGMEKKLLQATLQQAFPSAQNNFWVTSACLCSPRGTESPPSEAIRACRPRLLEELAGVTRVLLCGSIAVESISPEQGKISSCRGRAFSIDDLPGTAFLATYHPSKVLRDPSSYTDFFKDLLKWGNLGRDFPPVPLPRIRTCQSVRDIRQMIQAVREAGIYSCDLETTGLDPLVDRILLLGIQSQVDFTWQIPDTLLEDRSVLRLLKDFFADLSLFSVGHNSGSFDSKFLLHLFGIDWRPTLDTMLAHYLLDERQGGHSLDELTKTYLNFPDYKRTVKAELERITEDRRREVKAAKKLGRDQEVISPTYADIPREILSVYLARDSQGTLLLTEPLLDEMESEDVRRTHDDILLPAALALREIELTGTLLDTSYLTDLGKTLRSELDRERQAVQDLAGKIGLLSFNPNSPKQVADLLYDRLRIPTKSRSTDKEHLEALQEKFPIVKSILDCRQKERIIGTYIDGLLDRVSADSRIRGDFLLHGTVTGRLSSRDPNLQNIPVMIGPMIRNAFIATPGWKLIEADYNQLELRVAAWYSRDPLLIHYYLNDFDVHRMVASEVFNVPPEQVTENQRYIAKYIDFGIIYGRQAPSLAHGELKCSVQKAQEYIDSFLSKFHGLAEWMKKVQSQALEEGFVSTPFGRRRRFPLILDSLRGDILRQAVNAPIQSMASDLCLTALSRLHRVLPSRNARLLLTVHDSILFEVREDYLEETSGIIRYEMSENCPIESPIPFKVDLKSGDRWGSLDKRNRPIA